MLSDVAITATMASRWHGIVMAYPLSRVILLVDDLNLNFYLNVAGSTWNDASVTASLGLHQGISTMEAMVCIRMGGMIVPWFG